MKKTDIEVVKFALSTTKGKSDAEIAALCGVTPSDVTQLRATLSIPLDYKPESLKEYAKRYILEMSPDQKKEYIERVEKVSPGFAWKMVEGMPSQTLDIPNAPQPINITQHILKVYGPTDGTSTDILPSTSETIRLAAGSGK